MLLTPAATVFTLAGVGGDYAGAGGWTGLLAPGELMPHTRAQLRSGAALRRAASAESDLSFRRWEGAPGGGGGGGGGGGAGLNLGGGGAQRGAKRGASAGARRPRAVSTAAGGASPLQGGSGRGAGDLEAGLWLPPALASADAVLEGSGGGGGGSQQQVAAPGLGDPVPSLGAWLVPDGGPREGSGSEAGGGGGGSGMSAPLQLPRSPPMRVPAPGGGGGAPAASAATAAGAVVALRLPGAPPKERILATQSAPLGGLASPPNAEAPIAVEPLPEERPYPAAGSSSQEMEVAEERWQQKQQQQPAGKLTQPAAEAPGPRTPTKPREMAPSPFGAPVSCQSPGSAPSTGRGEGEDSVAQITADVLKCV
jgi:hypothetical protein